MNKNIKLAVAGAVLALSASANAGIVIPAGDWTLDVNGNVNAFANYTHSDAFKAGSASSVDYINGGLALGKSADGGQHTDKAIGINTGLLPAWLGFTGSTRQNDTDVSFTISMQPNVSGNGVTGDNGTNSNYTGTLWRQAFITFGDKSWGSVKLGKDLGVYAGDAILNDMTLLGVGAGAGLSGASTTLGGIGTGYQYAAWKGQIAYTTPNFNGFSATAAITNPNQGFGSANQDRFGFEAKASYSFASDGFSGKIWASGATYDVTNAAVSACTVSVITDSVLCVATTTAASSNHYTVSAGDIGAHIDAGPFGATAYYYGGSGAGTTFLGNLGATAAGAKRDSDGGYIQLTYATPVKTKVGLAYGISNLDRASGESSTATTAAANGTGNVGALVKSNERYTVGLYHPLTKHLNLVAEYNNVQSEAHDGSKQESQTYSAGAILFF